MIAAAGALPLGFQLFDLAFVVVDHGLHLLQLQPLLVQRKLQLIRIVGEQFLPLGDIVTLLHQELRDGLILILIDLSHIFRNHHSGEPVALGDGARVADLPHRLDIDPGSILPAAGQRQSHDTRQQQRCSFPQFHRKTSVSKAYTFHQQHYT